MPFAFSCFPFAVLSETLRKLVGELEKLQTQLDTWAVGSTEPSEEVRLDVLEAWRLLFVALVHP